MHHLTIKEVFDRLDSGWDGLTTKQVHERLRKYGENKLKKTRRFRALKVFLEQFKSFLIIILLLAASISFFMESKVDSTIIFIIILLNAGIGFFQEYRSEKAIESLKKILSVNSKVLRNGKVVVVNSKNIVPGDILILNEGDKVMADARIIKSNGLKVSEAALTGESVPEGKISKELSEDTSLADRVNMVYQGTQVMSGNARAIVIDTGMKTELGKISELVQDIKPEKNPFKDKLDRFARKIGILVIILSLLVILLLTITGSSFFNSILVAVSLSVASIPEGLPAVITLSLAFATRRMISRNVLVRKLPASETLGRATVICTDKTGTLTEGKMHVSDIYTNGKINPQKNKELLLKIGILCNKARIERNKVKEYFIGDPTEIALIVSAKNNFLDKPKLTKEQPKLEEFPFSSERKMMSIVRKSERKIISYVKGAPEKIIEKAAYELIDGKKVKLENVDRQRLIKVYEDMANKGLRVLGFAFREFPSYQEEITQKVAEENLVFVGFQGMIDPPRKEVKGAINLCKKAGIRVIMVTGDSELTANAVAKNIGLEGSSISSRKLKEMDDKELFDRIEKVSIFSRISPEDKLRIINVLKQKNEVVAMTGDGVNDALALKRADIGIATGIRGTDVARDSSDIILIDDNFASIVEGVKEGRTIYENIKKFIKFLLTANFSEVLLVLLVLLIWRNPELLPLLPLQILWINLVTDSFPALALSADPLEKEVMSRNPSKQDILNGIKLFVIFAGLLTFFINFLFFYLNMEDIDKARTMAVTASIVFEMFLVFNCKTTKSAFKAPFNKYLLLAIFVSVTLHLIVLYTPLNTLFHFVEISFKDWTLLIGAGIVGFFIVEGFKKIDRNIFKSKSPLNKKS